MKRKLIVVLLAFLAITLMAVPVLALQDEPPPPVTAENIIFLGMIASVVTFVLRILATYVNVHPGRVVVNIFIFILSGFFAWQWSGVAFLPFPSDLGLAWQWLNDLFAMATPILGTASFIYNLLYEKVAVPAWARFASPKSAG